MRATPAKSRGELLAGGAVLQVQQVRDVDAAAGDQGADDHQREVDVMLVLDEVGLSTLPAPRARRAARTAAGGRSCRVGRAACTARSIRLRERGLCAEEVRRACGDTPAQQPGEDRAEREDHQRHDHDRRLVVVMVIVVAVSMTVRVGVIVTACRDERDRRELAVDVRRSAAAAAGRPAGLRTRGSRGGSV